MDVVGTIMDSYDETRVNPGREPSTMSKGSFTWFFGSNVCGEYIRIIDHSVGKDNVYFINNRMNFENFVRDFCSVH